MLSVLHSFLRSGLGPKVVVLEDARGLWEGLEGHTFGMACGYCPCPLFPRHRDVSVL